MNEAVEHKQQCSKEIAELKEKLSINQIVQDDEEKTPKVSLDDREVAYRQTIAEADSLLAKLESDYQVTIRYGKRKFILTFQLFFLIQQLAS